MLKLIGQPRRLLHIEGQVSSFWWNQRSTLFGASRCDNFVRLLGHRHSSLINVPDVLCFIFVPVHYSAKLLKEIVNVGSFESCSTTDARSFRCSDWDTVFMCCRGGGVNLVFVPLAGSFIHQTLNTDIHDPFFFYYRVVVVLVIIVVIVVVIIIVTVTHISLIKASVSWSQKVVC